MALPDAKRVKMIPVTVTMDISGTSTSQDDSAEGAKGQHDSEDIAPSAAASMDSTLQKSKNRHDQASQTIQYTYRKPNFAYFRLYLINTSSDSSVVSIPSTLTLQSKEESSLDAVTAHIHLTAAIQQFLGVHGVAQINLDILKVEQNTVLLRIPEDARRAFVAAVGGWVGGRGTLGWRILGEANCWDARAGTLAKSGRDLFDAIF